MKHILSLLAILSVAAPVAAERQPFSRYQTILDRQMFGELPVGFDPTKMPNEVARSSSKQGPELTKEQEKLQSAIHFSAINVTPEGATAVGFTDNSNPKAPVHYYLKVGETRDGWKVLEADAKSASMTIAKGDIEVSLSIGGNSGAGAGQTKPRTADSSEQAGGSAMLRTLRGRRALREKREADAFKKFREEQEAKEAKEAAAKAEREAEREEQREAEREEQRKQLMAIQEELRKAREEKAQQRQQQEAEENADNDTE
ncbi:MAG: hypothetical protein IJG84_04165 [Kiritimatiellae bacterium]|nr:hypothetical protein [Kiritimatiellia bacterium]